MKNLFITFVLCLFLIKGFAAEQQEEWGGRWNSSKNSYSIIPQLPFTHEVYDEIVIIYNSQPDRDIHCEILDEYGNVVQSYDISQINSAYIALPINNLPSNHTYMIVLTSPEPTDRAYTTFEK